ncbi:putative membrane protein [Halanaerobium saccharolyticum]|uniref:Putative membrane protein n=1 Tax=Halanaerobium saccharolyticum TaxID=43595 RepID=A0A4R7ZEL6_9FIRM|nr:YibE/F family protein [Halanaerobium saccharolyticum]RAK11734.1 putative membrane protein [Halanaerobium saccharolyticum]TDW07575.1 putative membrane protein [Halanaerobium saccharolyticum]TDX64496.1 putative membrane protein [Halanaerobium saccharolyticum]
MKFSWNDFKKSHYLETGDLILVLLVIISIVLLLFLPLKQLILGASADTPKIAAADNTVRVKASVIAVDNSNLHQSGIVKTGEQYFKAKIETGSYEGENIKVVNYLSGAMQLDTVFESGDQALITLRKDENDRISSATAVDHYRIEIELILLLIFALLLIIFAGLTGLKAALSFVFTGVVVWRVLLPAFLGGWNPVIIAFIIVSVITFVIIFLIGGISLRGIVAYLGSMSGVALTAFFALYFGKLMKIEGSVKEFSETLLYSGYEHLELTSIFLAGIFIASSGAVMDIAMDIAASMAEIKLNRPTIKIWPHIKSGFNIGRAVIGTMTTTLLLAYSGSYTTLLLVLMAQGTPTMNIMNLRYVSAEFLNTVVGSFGLVLVAPITAVIGGLIYSNWHPPEHK